MNETKLLDMSGMTLDHVASLRLPALEAALERVIAEAVGPDDPLARFSASI